LDLAFARTPDFGLLPKGREDLAFARTPGFLGVLLKEAVW